ncbi:TnsD family transposase [Brevibacillus sp. NRS-1366]|uniref:TnsD family transposase n=1 Tax=Brevibacillus sp. NRS-1366 TaxID=3233899 RepID=UPI003D1A1113
MLNNFPTPYSDELLYSILARYHMAVGNISPKHSTEELFGKRTIRSVVDLPCNLERLAERINNPMVNADYLIDNHTMFPYFGAFFQSEQYEKVRELMKSEYGDRVHTTAGIAASSIIPKEYLMHCHECREEDREKYGETYWHRVHQLPGVMVCPKHEIPLYETDVSVKATNQHEYIIATEENTRSKEKTVSMGDTSFQHLLTFAKMANELLLDQYRQTHDNHLQQQYKRKLAENNFVTSGGFVNRSKLYRSFQGTFGKATLQYLQSQIEYIERDWLTMIFQHHRKSFHPIRHILVIMFLGDTLPSYFEESTSFRPFGVGPWLCLNPTCQDYRKPVVELKVTRCYQTKRPVGTFTCHCGFMYSRRGPDQCRDDQYKIGRIKAFGDVWKGKLKELISEGETLRGIAKILQCDPQTVKRQATLLNVPYSRSGETLESGKNNPRFHQGELTKVDESEVSNSKEEWLFLQEKHPSLSTADLRRLRPDLYAFLYRNDKDWLKGNSPTGRKKVHVNNNRVDWEKRDIEMVEVVKKVVEEWDRGADKLTRITVSAIGKKVNRLSLLQKKKEMLPETTAYINSVVEDAEAFQLRRVKWIADRMQGDGEEVSEWKLNRRAGIRPDASAKVKRLVTVSANNYNW